MSSEDLTDLLRAKPFVPFRLYSSGGRTHEIRHSDQALVLRTRVILPISSTGSEVPERSEHLALSHVVRAEELSPPVTSPHNGNGGA